MRTVPLTVYRAGVVDDVGGEAEVAQSVARVIDRLGERAPVVIGSIQQHLAAEITELAVDGQLVELLRASVAGNVETVFDALRYAIDLQRVEPPTAALEYARRVAQHDIPVNAVVRAYRLGQQQMLMLVLDEIRAGDLEPGLALRTFEVISTVTFSYIDWISQQVIDTYELERDRWLENRNSVRAVRVRELLDVTEDQLGQIDVDAMTAAVRYPLLRSHAALILWHPQPQGQGGELLGLERFLRGLADSLQLRDAPLFVAVDRISGWGWLPLDGPVADLADRVADFARGVEDPPRVALGTAQGGLAGFRRSHRQARQAHSVAVAGSAARGVVAAGEPGVVAAALLGADLPQARRWVHETLGPLAADTDNDARLRETLRVFLLCGSSHKAAAEQLNLHHNSVKYRIRRAVERRGRPIIGDRIDVELALLLCQQYGAAVLAGPGGEVTPHGV
ncbi:MAG: helix-turn-helix domain-containing protein [Actinomycetota bacterium]|nr:helix-turn-helix domain-containing protein [Actinomycetota bacterium]